MAQNKGVSSLLQALDAYPKLASVSQVKTLSGAAVSLAAVVLIVVLSATEVSRYYTTHIEDHLIVDLDSPTGKLRIDFDVTLKHIPCSLASVDAMDVSGEQDLDITHHIKKQRLDADGNPLGHEEHHDMKQTIQEGDGSQAADANKHPSEKKDYCGSCYGAEEKEGQCCNTCDEVRLAYRNKGWALDVLKEIEQCVKAGETNEVFSSQLERGDGCRMFGYIETQKVSGNFHFAPGKSFKNAHVHVHDLASFDAEAFNISHHVEYLRFGQSYPGAVQPLNGVTHLVEEKGGMFMYYTKVVPTTYKFLNGTVLRTNQFSVTQHHKTGQPVNMRKGLGLPGVFFFYEISPIKVEFHERQPGLAHLLAQLCAIFGGIFTVSGVIDRLIYTGVKAIKGVAAPGKII